MPDFRFIKFTMVMDSFGSRGYRGPSVRILLVDDCTAILNQLSNMLQPEYEVVGKIADGNLVCPVVAVLNPDIVILDISMGERSGIEIARRLREQGYAKEIIFLTVHEDPDFVIAAIGAGGRAYVTKPRITEDLKLAVQSVLSHRVFISAPLKWE